LRDTIVDSYYSCVFTLLPYEKSAHGDRGITRHGQPAQRVRPTHERVRLGSGHYPLFGAYPGDVVGAMRAGLRATVMAALLWAMVTEVPGQVGEGLPVLPAAYHYIYMHGLCTGGGSPPPVTMRTTPARGRVPCALGAILQILRATPCAQWRDMDKPSPRSDR